MLHGESYFERLWCAYEVATFLAVKPVARVDFVPLWLAPWLLAAMALDLLCSWLVMLLIPTAYTPVARRLGGARGVVVGEVAVTVLGYAPLVGLLFVGFRAKARAQRRLLGQLRAFAFGRTRCSDPADRPKV